MTRNHLKTGEECHVPQTVDNINSRPNMGTMNDLLSQTCRIYGCC
jgi:hypothetical protein